MDPATYAPGGIIPVLPAGAGAPIPPGGIFGEEHTGWTGFPPGGPGGPVDVVDPLGPPSWPAGPDNDPFAGDMADFDWVQEHRPDETGVTPGGSNHPGAGAMGWTIGLGVGVGPGFVQPSPHVTVGVGPHAHGGLPSLFGPAYAGPGFRGVDVFSVISLGQDTDVDASGAWSARESALDYDLWFVDLGAPGGPVSVPGKPITVFVPGWTGATFVDDYVARWVPDLSGLAPGAGPFVWNSVAIDPPGGPPHDQITEIDAIVGFLAVPEPATMTLLGLGLAGLVVRRFRKRP